LPQKPLPGANCALQLGHEFMFNNSDNPQLTQRLAFLSLSVPHFGHGQYSSPQNGQNFKLLANFFEQLEQ
jgi:hypothetical protein